MQKQLLSLLVVWALFSCEDVVEVETPTEPPRLIVEALIRIDNGAPITTARIAVSQSSSFFEDIQPVSVDGLSIQNLDRTNASPLEPQTLVFLETAPGSYEVTAETDFFTSGRLLLVIDVDGERYIARTTFVPTSPIDRVVQGDQTLFSGEEKEVVIAFTDNGERDDFYIFDFGFGEFLGTEDEFYQGQQFEFSYFYDDNVEAGDTLRISILGADEAFYNYMNQIVAQAGGDQGPFQTPAATTKGNVINVTGVSDVTTFMGTGNTDKFALGYFAVVQEYVETITLE
ncbi:DUF4249 family protein [Maribacter sp. 2307ULW6-5]|uniref:DUF4249 family protein n=1 Tax=Maribacter sp. 2307ULW6-5 TaxID=3386275 RepID=UPI0039BCF1BA